MSRAVPNFPMPGTPQFAAKFPKVAGIGRIGLGSAAIGGTVLFGLGILSEIGRAARERPVAMNTFVKGPGAPGRYLSLGEMPTSGVRFAGRYRRRF